MNHRQPRMNHRQPRLIVLAIDDDEDADALIRWLADNKFIDLPDGPRNIPTRLATDGDVYLAAMHGLDLRDVTKVECTRQREMLEDEGLA